LNGAPLRKTEKPPDEMIWVGRPELKLPDHGIGAKKTRNPRAKKYALVSFMRKNKRKIIFVKIARPVGQAFH
jgi:hypothetical protein